MGNETASIRKEMERLSDEYKRFVGRKISFIVASVLLIFITAGVSVTLGPYDISFIDAYSIIFQGIHDIIFRFHNIYAFIQFLDENYMVKEWVIWQQRLPPIVMGVIAGISLGIAGAEMQGILRNPLASPYTLGISSAAVFGAALAIIINLSIVRAADERFLIVVNAFFFAILSSSLIYGISKMKNATPETMILAGIAITYLFMALTQLLKYFAPAEEVKETVVWSFGALSANWSEILISFVIVLSCVPVLMLKVWDLNVMSAGDEVAKSLGVDVERTRQLCFFLSSFLTAGTVCFTGPISFIGLVSPHICRMVIGADNRFLVPASGLFGAALLIAADTVAKIVISPVIIPVGIITAFMGVPLFLYLILRRSREYW